ncbi:MAG: cytochrome c biogenesis protein/redoxin [Coriobacteriales bacterium]|nr:cytochrome c biogenesis protein/redoxin [Coriobacteriales bacterium]
MGVSVGAVFLEGLLGFFSPCVLPLVPLYAAYLSGGIAHRVRLLVNTLFFVAGIGVAFLLLGLAATTLGRALSAYSDALARVGGIVIMLFGLLQLGFLGTSSHLSQEHRLPMRFDKLAMNPLTALLMGFFFSFAWTPCVGPGLASVLVMASAASTRWAGLMLVGVYTLGFALPFVAVGLLADAALSFLRKHRSVVRVTQVVGGIVLVLVGFGMMMGWTQAATRFLAGLGGTTNPVEQVEEAASAAAEQSDQTAQVEAQESSRPASIDFSLEDQYGNLHTLSSYKGKIVLLNFWTTWCGYCKQEMPDLEKLYQEQGQNEGEIVVLGVANPSNPLAKSAADVSRAEVTAFLEENGYSYPTVMDLTGDVFRGYGISAYPTTFAIDANGNVAVYYPGYMTREIMNELIARARSEE